MNTRYTTVNLDVSQQGSIPSITLSQYDLGVGLSFYIMDGGLPYSEFAETDTVVLSGTKPSGVGFTVPAYYKSGNLCSFRTPQAMTTEAGTVTCEITITKVNNISVSTANFFVEVEASAHAHETVDEDIEDFSLIANQVGEYKAVAVRAAQQAAQSATDAAASASSAEESMEAAQSAASSAIAAKDDIQEYIDDSEAWARGTRGGTAVPSTDETYENNAKYYAEQSSQASMDAGVSATEAAASAQEAAASVVGAVKYTAQSLTTEQKAQARTNIGAASPSDIPSGTVRYDTSQSLTDTQKTQALVNIGGALAGSVAGEFNTFTAYAVGDTVIYQSKLYEFTSAHAAGAWNASHVTAISVMDEVSDLKGDLDELETLIEEGESGLSNSAKEALLNCFRHISFIDDDADYYGNLANALRNVISISVTFNQGNNVITKTDKLDDLRSFLTVVATYEGGETENVNDYAIIGSFQAPMSNIAVKYGGRIASFNVTVKELPSGYTEKNYIISDKTQYISTNITETDVADCGYRVKVSQPEYDDRGAHLFSNLNVQCSNLWYYQPSNLKDLGGKHKGNSTRINITGISRVWSLNTVYEIESFMNGGNAVCLNGERVFDLAKGSDASSANKMCILGYGYDPTASKWRTKGNTYYIKVFNADMTKKYDFVPCVNSSNVVGLYELVTNTFYAPTVGTLTSG